MTAQLSADATHLAEIDETIDSIVAALGQIDTCQDKGRIHSKIQALIRALSGGKTSRKELLSAVVSAK